MLQNLRYNQQNPEKPQKVVPFRDCKITRFFQMALEGGAKIVMVLTVNPLASEGQETIHMLR